MKASREMQIASSRKRLLSASRSPSPGGDDDDGSVSDYEGSHGLSKSKSNPPRKRQKTKHATVTNLPNTTPKIPAAFKTADDVPLFSAKWWKEVSSRDAFWKELKKRVPKSELRRRLNVSIMDDLNEDAKAADVNVNATTTNAKPKPAKGKQKPNQAVETAHLSGHLRAKMAQEEANNLGKSLPSNKDNDMFGVEQYLVDSSVEDADRLDASNRVSKEADKILKELIKTRADIAVDMEEKSKNKAAIEAQLKIEQEIENMRQVESKEKKVGKNVEKTNVLGEGSGTMSIMNDENIISQANGTEGRNAGTGNDDVQFIDMSKESGTVAAATAGTAVEDRENTLGRQEVARDPDLNQTIANESGGKSIGTWEPNRF